MTNVKTLLTAAALALAPALAGAACWEGHSQQAMSCEEGYVYDTETQACVVVAS